MCTSKKHGIAKGNRFVLIVLTSFTLMFSAFSNNVCGQKHIVHLMQADSSQKDSVVWNENVVISGTVKTTDGQPIPGATIYFNEEEVTTTDSDGRFGFNRKMEGYPLNTTLRAQYEGMRDVVRSYHPAMYSTDYTIMMQKKDEYCCRLNMTAIKLEFEKKEVNLNDDHMVLLEKLASKLRNQPALRIEITGFGASNIRSTMSKYRQEAVRNYLVDKAGISEERFVLTTQSSREKENLILIKSTK